MEKYNLDIDIKIFCVTADSFPDGILAAHQKLHSLLPTSAGRNFFGVSRPEDGSKIIYRAGVEESFGGEAEQYNCEKIIIKKGVYITIDIPDFHKDIQSIGRAFQELLKDPDIDQEGYCVEMYKGESEVKCMVRLNSKLT
ncbi:MAG: transcriptional regulator [bacterium]